MATDYVFTAGTETWETTGLATTWVWTMDSRTREYVKTKIGGAEGGSRILRISIDDRRYNEQQIIEEMAFANPFRNGALRLLRTDGADDNYISDIDPTYHLTPDELLPYFDIKDPDIFRTTMTEIASELILRRIQDIGGKHATAEQTEILREIIDERYRVDKSQKPYREEQKARATAGKPV